MLFRSLKHCTYCKTMTNHKTWRSRNYPGSKEYLKTVTTKRNLKKPKLPSTRHQTTSSKIHIKIHDNSPLTETNKVAYLKKKTVNNDGVEVEEEVSKKKLMVIFSDDNKVMNFDEENDKNVFLKSDRTKKNTSSENECHVTYAGTDSTMYDDPKNNYNHVVD